VLAFFVNQVSGMSNVNVNVSFGLIYFLSVISSRSNELQESIEAIKSMCKEMSISAKTTSRITAEWSKLAKAVHSLDFTVRNHYDMLYPLPHHIKVQDGRKAHFFIFD
jgi:phosphatidate phosphatase PAH1